MQFGILGPLEISDEGRRVEAASRFPRTKLWTARNAPGASTAVGGRLLAYVRLTAMGANGVTLEHPVAVNNLESVLTYEGTHEVHTLLVVEALTGENAFR